MLLVVSIFVVGLSNVSSSVDYRIGFEFYEFDECRMRGSYHLRFVRDTDTNNMEIIPVSAE